jgi:hypothetical protein
MEMTSADRAILGLLNNPKIIPPNDIVHKYTVASHNDVELLVIKVILNIDINDKGQRGDGERMLYENNFDAYKLSETIIKKILRPLGLLKTISWGVLIVIDASGNRIIEHSMIKN